MKISGRQFILFLIVALVFVIYGCADDSGEEIGTFLLDDSETVPFPGAGPIIYLSYENRVGMQLGQGYDSVAQNTSQATCINFDLVDPAGSWETWTIVEVVKSMSELKSSLSVNASASLNLGLYNGSFQSGFLHKMEYSSRTIFALARIKLKGPYNTINSPKLKDEIKYKGDGNQRSAQEIYDICGDYYLGTIASGGTLIAVITIETNSQEEKDTITSELKASSINAEGGVKVKSEFAQTLAKYKVKTEVYAVGCEPISPKTDFDEFMNMVDDFGPKIQECVDDPHKGVLDTALVATYFSMSSIIQAAIDEKLNVSEQQKKLNTLIDYYTSYGKMALDIGHIITHQSAYDFTTSPEYNTPVLLEQLRNDIIEEYGGYKQIVYEAVTDCADDPYDCSMPETLPEEKYPQNIKLPTLKDFNPSDCIEVILKYGAPLDDEHYTIYLGGDVNKPFEVYCRDMNTESPKTYLDLPQGDKTNYATFTRYWQWKKDGSKYWPDLTTTYERIHIIPGQSQITVDICDTSFAKTDVKESDKKTNQSSSSFPVASFGCPAPLSYVPYGVTIGSYRGTKTPEYPGTADINLIGTPFAISDDAKWSYFGTSDVGFIHISTDKKTAGFGVGGNNGYLKTGISGSIKLKWVGH